MKKTTARKTIVTPGTRVSQATIDKIKAMGMTAALKKAKTASPEMKEGLLRMYGARRVSAAMGSAKPAGKTGDAGRAAGARSMMPKTPKSPDSAKAAGARSIMPKPKPKVAKSPDEARAGYTTGPKPAAKTADKARQSAMSSSKPSKPSKPTKKNVGSKIADAFTFKPSK